MFERCILLYLPIYWIIKRSSLKNFQSGIDYFSLLLFLFFSQICYQYIFNLRIVASLAIIITLSREMLSFKNSFVVIN